MRWNAEMVLYVFLSSLLAMIFLYDILCDYDHVYPEVLWISDRTTSGLGAARGTSEPQYEGSAPRARTDGQTNCTGQTTNSSGEDFLSGEYDREYANQPQRWMECGKVNQGQRDCGEGRGGGGGGEVGGCEKTSRDNREGRERGGGRGIEGAEGSRAMEEAKVQGERDEGEKETPNMGQATSWRGWRGWRGRDVLQPLHLDPLASVLRPLSDPFRVFDFNFLAPPESVSSVTLHVSTPLPFIVLLLNLQIFCRLQFLPRTSPRWL
jgi:hypothetical protein